MKHAVSFYNNYYGYHTVTGSTVSCSFVTSCACLYFESTAIKMILLWRQLLGIFTNYILFSLAPVYPLTSNTSDQRVKYFKKYIINWNFNTWIISVKYLKQNRQLLILNNIMLFVEILTFRLNVIY